MSGSTRKTRVVKFPITPILEALGQPIPGGSRSGRVKAKCIFHDDMVASATIDYKNQRFHCFACDVSGDAVDLLRTQEGLTFEAALIRCEELTGHSQPGVRGKPGTSPGLFDDAGYS